MNQLLEWVTVVLPVLTITLGFGIFIYIGINNLDDTKTNVAYGSSFNHIPMGNPLIWLGLIIAYIIYEIITKNEEVF